MTIDDMPDPHLPTPLPASVADKLLELLGTDDTFRELFASDTGAALLHAGYCAADGNAEDQENLRRWVTRLNFRTLASKEEICEAREEMKAALTHGLNMQPILLHAADGNRYIKRE